MEYVRGSQAVDHRPDFIGGIDNEALDFDQLDAYIHATTPPTTSTNGTVTNSQSHLPESPPDSGSEPYSPGDLHGITIVSSSTSTAAANNNQDGGLHHSRAANDAGSLQNNLPPHLTVISPGSVNDMSLPPHLLAEPNNLYTSGLSGSSQDRSNRNHAENLVPKCEPISTPKHVHESGGLILAGVNEQQFLMHQPSPVTLIEYPMACSSPMSNVCPSDVSDQLHHSNDQLVQLMPAIYGTTSGNSSGGQMQLIRPNSTTGGAQPGLPQQIGASRKRKSSQTSIGQPPSAVIKPEPDLNPSISRMIGLKQVISDDMEPSNISMDSTSGTADSSDTCPMQSIRFSPFQQNQWHVLCNNSLQNLHPPHYKVDADKGFNFSNSDDAFVCQKKNHFQITVHAQLNGTANFVRTSTGLEKIQSFHIHFYGVKLEAPNQTIRIEQSQSDRSKKPFHPVAVDLQNGQICKVTVGRLHFSETTNNNMRKKGRPNPEQRYFQLVVGLHAHTHSGNFPIVSQGSERIIVRASNPGQFENDVELCWQRGVTMDSIFHSGRVGINTDRPDESLVVHGNIKISGHLVQPSDSRAKQEISELDTSEQLKNVQKIRVVKYRYEPEFALHSGLVEPGDRVNEIIDTGVIAQEVQQVLPDAVREGGSIILPSGQVIDKFLHVNKDRIFMENIGAVKELCKVTGSLETRIEQLERVNARLMRIQKLKRSNSCSDDECHHSTKNSIDDEICSNKTIQIIIIVLIIIMTVCLTAISTLYFVERQSSLGRFGIGQGLYVANGKSGGSAFNHYETANDPFRSLHHSTPLLPSWSKPTKKHHASSDNADKAEDFSKTNTKWLSNEADDNEIASNSIIDPAQYNNKKNETKTFSEPLISKAVDGKNKNVYNFKGDSPHEAEDTAIEDKPATPVLTHVKEMELQVSKEVGLPEFCENIASRDPQLCQSVCCEENSQGLEKSSCFEDAEMGSELKYNVSQATQEEVPIDIKDVTNLNSNDEALDNLNVSSQVEVPLSPKENDELEQDVGCYKINLILRASTFNTTLNTQEICGGEQGVVFSILVPISKFMKETQIELLFINPEKKISEWTMCEHKDRTNDFPSNPETSGNQIYQPILQREMTKPSFPIQIPQYGTFDRYMEFRTLLKSSTKDICQLTHDTTTKFLQYNIKLYRDCS